jgi:hypothetical protein
VWNEQIAHLIWNVGSIYKDLLLAKTMDIDEFVYYSYSLYGINLIKGLSMKYHVYAILIQDIKDLIE